MLMVAGALLVLLLPHAAAQEGAAKAGYHLLKKNPIPGEATYYDHLSVDPESRRVFVSFGGEVAALDADSGDVVAGSRD